MRASVGWVREGGRALAGNQAQGPEMLTSVPVWCGWRVKNHASQLWALKHLLCKETLRPDPGRSSNRGSRDPEMLDLGSELRASVGASRQCLF
jgi:hypothetical protein